jgi:hypothetical protein
MFTVDVSLSLPPSFPHSLLWMESMDLLDLIARVVVWREEGEHELTK